MKIAFLGDVALFGSNTVRSGSYRQRMKMTRQILEDCDYVVANLETPLTTANRVIGGKSAYLKGLPEDVEILEWLGVTHCSLANNHMFDYRDEGLLETIQVLENHGIKWYGANGRSCYIESNDDRIALHGYCCYSTNGKGLERKEPYVNVLDPNQIELDLNADEQTGYYSVLSCHWGQEHVHYPNYDHIELARKILAGKKATIHGQHPHVIQGLEYVGEALVAYSLGNFCFDDIYTNKSSKPLVKLSDDNKETFILILEVDRNRLVCYETIPVSFVDGIYQLDESISTRISEWSDFLTNDKKEYVERRSADLNDYLKSRRKMRNPQWYWKRMRVESIRMIANARHNSKRYKQLIKGYLTE